MPSPQDSAHLDVLAEQAGAEHADRILAVLETFPAEVAQEILGTRALDKAIENGAVVLRMTTPEDEVRRFSALIRAAYSARLAVALMPAAGRA